MNKEDYDEQLKRDQFEFEQEVEEGKKEIEYELKFSPSGTITMTGIGGSYQIDGFYGEKPFLDETRELTGKFTDYLTGLEPSWEWYGVD